MSNVGKTIPHDSASGHVSGQALFLDDLVPRGDELLVGVAVSPRAAGQLKSVGISRALSFDGVVCCLTADDIPGEKYFGPHFADEPVLAEGEVLYVGQPVAVLAAESPRALRAGLAAVEVDLVESKPVLTIEQAMEMERFLGPPRTIRRGDPDAVFRSAPHKLTGRFVNGGQEQFYLESQAAIAIPGEDGQMVVHSSTQGPTEIQHVVAALLGLDQHQVICHCRRMGGAFGGKETQAAIPAMLAALVAHTTGRAARLVYDKDRDMESTGKRHAYLTDWEVAFDDDGQILAMKTSFYSNGGAAADLSMAVLERSMLHAENAYFVPAVEIAGRVCRTNLPPNTAFRGFGGPQAMAAMESIIHEIAVHLQRDPLDIQRLNLYGNQDRNVTPYGQVVGRNHLPEIVATLTERCDYASRKTKIEAANQTDPLWLRGIALAPVKFGISFTTKFLNQANALVNVYTDGTIQVSTGATEMGQGVNTKIRQLVADAFGLSWDRVLLMPTSTEKNANTSPTAASAGTDLNGAAAVNACEKIASRLAALAARQFASDELGLCESPADVVFENGQVVDRRNPNQRCSFAELCRLAHLERVDLCARGFYATPGVDFNRETGQGNPFLYFTQGAAVAEVQIDRFTGDLDVCRVDLLIDIGKSINPGVDMGQIYGGFVQGMGWVTGECLVYDDRGQLLSMSPTTYKIPAISDIPEEFNCELFPCDDNVLNIRRSKAVGEPPLMHGIAIWGAVKQALSSVSGDVQRELRLPATGEEILRCLTLADRGEPPPAAQVAGNGWTVPPVQVTDAPQSRPTAKG